MVYPEHAVQIDSPKEGPGFFLLLLLSKRDQIIYVALIEKPLIVLNEVFVQICRVFLVAEKNEVS
jgi:hypothetical protein